VARSGVKLTRKGGKGAHTQLPHKALPKRLRDEEIWRLKVYDGRTIAEIAKMLGVGKRTVDRSLARMRSERSLENEKSLKWSVRDSLAEKDLAQRKMLEIMQRPPLKDREGNTIDDAHIRIEATRVFAQISDHKDKMFGFRDVKIRREIRELRKRGDTIQRVIQRKKAP